jgi:hypothetical protein
LERLARARERRSSTSRRGTAVSRLYRSSVHNNYWIAFTKDQGWVAFPNRENGWEQRHPARGIDPLYLREVPAKQAASAGFPQENISQELNRVA